MKKNSPFAIVYLTLILLLLYLPIIIVVTFSFNGNAGRTAAFVFEGFSFQWYRDLFDPISGYGEALLTSLEVAFFSVLISCVIGTLGAVGMLRRGQRLTLKDRAAGSLKAASEQLVMLPIMIPELILGIAFMAVFTYAGLPFGRLTLILSHVTFCIPYILITVKSRLQTLDPSLVEASRDLGASPLKAFLTVTLPLAAPAILSGALLAFAMSMDDFVISFFVNGAQTTTLPLKVYSSVRVGLTPKVNALCTVMLGTAFLLVALGQLFTGNPKAKDASK